MKHLRDAVIVGYLRSAFSRARPQEPEKDVFNNIRADKLAGTVARELIKRTGVQPEDIDEVIVGTSRADGEQFTWGGRLTSFLADIPTGAASHSVDRQCASSLTAVDNGAMEIMCGFSDTVLSIGVEHMTHLPIGAMSGPNEDRPAFGPDAGPHPDLYDDPKYGFLDIRSSFEMGGTAEKLGRLAGISRDEMDRWSYRSHQLAVKAGQEGYFTDEILPVEGTTPDGKKIMVDADQSVRSDTTLEQMKQLKPAFSADGLITAGNSSTVSDGASALLLMSREKASRSGLKPMAGIVSMGWSGVDPAMMGMGPVPAIRKALKFAGLTVKDIDFWEINEAFAVVPLYTVRELGINPDKVNVKGGAVAIGHPLGATGNRLAGTLARTLNREGGRYGMAALCVGGGQGVATLIRNE